MPAIKRRVRFHQKLISCCLYVAPVFMLCPGKLAGQSTVFHHFTVDNGLPQNSMNCIFQDRQGFMWFGTQDGMCCFDGYKFKVFRYQPGEAIQDMLI